MISIVKATTQDIPSLVTLVNKAYRGDSSRRGWTHEVDLINGDMRIDEQQLQEILASDDGVFLIAKKDGFAVGTVHLKHDKKGLYLGLLSVDPDLQSSGTGGALLDAADVYASENHFPLIYMVVISERQELIDWYIRRGYILTDTKKSFAPPSKFGIPTKDLYIVELNKKI